MEDTMRIYGKYNSDMLMDLIDTLHKMHNLTTWKEKIFVGKLHKWLKDELINSKKEFGYALVSILFLTREICKNV